MKKIILILFAVAFSISLVHGQTGIPLTPALDSIVTSSSVDTSYCVKKVEGFYDVVTVQTIVTKSSGTVAGTAFLQGSLDGVHYASLADTLELANVATQSKIWSLTSSPYIYYRVAVIAPSSTQKIYIQSFILYRRKQ